MKNMINSRFYLLERAVTGFVPNISRNSCMHARCLLICASFFLVVSNLSAQKAEVVIEELLIEIDELIVDETLSKSGRDFYEIFYTQWVWPKTNDSFTIYIKERPARGNTTQLQILVNDLVVFENFLTPRYDDLVELSNFATAFVGNHIVTYEEIMQQLQGEDMKGTGIY